MKAKAYEYNKLLLSHKARCEFNQGKPDRIIILILAFHKHLMRIR